MIDDRARGRARWLTLGLPALLIVLGVLMGVPTASAGTVQLSFDGYIFVAGEGNAFGLSPGDIVTLSASYSDSDYDGVGYGTVFFNEGTGNTLTLSLGEITLHEFNDVGYHGGVSPSMMFFDGFLLSADLRMEIGVNGSPVSFQGTEGFFGGLDANENVIYGFWIPFAVPEPSSVALMGIGAAWAAAMGRRRLRV